MSDNVFWLLEMNIKSGELDNLKSLIKEMVEATQNDEPGALNYEYFISEDGSSCHVYERYEDSAAVMTHMGNFGAKFADRFTSILTPTRFNVYGPASDEVVNTLSGFGAVFHSQFYGFAR